MIKLTKETNEAFSLGGGTENNLTGNPAQTKQYYRNSTDANGDVSWLSDTKLKQMPPEV